MGETPALELDIFRLCVRVFGAECRCNGATGSESRITFKYDETPRRKLAMVRHSASDAQKFVDFGSDGPGAFSSTALKELRVERSSTASGMVSFRDNSRDSV
jgi:hypothetical protein